MVASGQMLSTYEGIRWEGETTDQAFNLTRQDGYKTAVRIKCTTDWKYPEKRYPFRTTLANVMINPAKDTGEIYVKIEKMQRWCGVGITRKLVGNGLKTSPVWEQNSSGGPAFAWYCDGKVVELRHKERSELA